MSQFIDAHWCDQIQFVDSLANEKTPFGRNAHKSFGPLFRMRQAFLTYSPHQENEPDFPQQHFSLLCSMYFLSRGKDLISRFCIFVSQNWTEKHSTLTIIPLYIQPPMLLMDNKSSIGIFHRHFLVPGTHVENLFDLMDCLSWTRRTQKDYDP